jgi:DNA-directed RNA polymerase II subunit RPB11
MQKINKISYKVLNQDKTIGNSRLEFKISGDNIDYIVANTIRRTILSEIPIYAFNDFKFEKNTSIFHNNYLKLRLRHMPVWSIKNDSEYVNVKTVKETTTDENEEDDVELEVEKDTNTSSLKQLTMYVNYKNKTSEIVTVSTADSKFYYNGKQIPSPYKNAIPIVKLQANQEIVFTAITNLGTEQDAAMYSAVCVVGYKEQKSDEFDFFIESRGQIDEIEILTIALKNINNRINKFLKVLDEEIKLQIDDEKTEGIIIINNEDHTLGNLLSRGLQQHDNISFAGYNLPHPLTKKVELHYKLNKKSSIKKMIVEVSEYYIDIFDKIRKSIEK